MEFSTIIVTNCNNIKEYSCDIVNNSLNIKFANNGTGKSTIAKAITLASKDESLDSLKPFDVIAKKDNSTKPSISGLNYSNVAVFNEDYLNKFVYQKSDLLINTFEIMIQSEDYTRHKFNIEEMLKNIRQPFDNNQEIQTLTAVLKKLCELLNLTTKKALDVRKAGIKSVLKDCKGALYNTPQELENFETFISDKSSTEWASWRFNGLRKFGNKGKCPYCAESDTEEKMEYNQLFKKNFDENSIKFSNEFKNHIETIKEYLSKEEITPLLNSINANTDREELEQRLIVFIGEANYIYTRLDCISSFSGYSINQNNMHDFENIFKNMKIDLASIVYFNTDKFQNEMNVINKQIDDTLDEIGKLKGEIHKFHSYLKRQVKRRCEDINLFLESAGYSYSFNIIIESDNTAHAYLQYNSKDIPPYNINAPIQHLSWGEKNALALLLFMFDAISQKADLIILDDPISSFDHHKKYAIINRLFKTGDRENSLYQRTVVLLTHDLEPIIDYIQVGGKISKESIKAYYLQNVNNKITETVIGKNDGIISIIILLKELAEANNIPMPVRIGCLRKYIEHTTTVLYDNASAYNLLSSLIHGRSKPNKKVNGNTVDMTKNEIADGTAVIKKYIADFDYQSVFTEFSQEKLLILYDNENNSYYKLLILRMYIGINAGARDRLKDNDDVLRKYVDETFHIENDYIYSLDIRMFDIVPKYYIERADEFIRTEHK